VVVVASVIVLAVIVLIVLAAVCHHCSWCSHCCLNNQTIKNIYAEPKCHPLKLFVNPVIW